MARKKTEGAAVTRGHLPVYYSCCGSYFFLRATFLAAFLRLLAIVVTSFLMAQINNVATDVKENLLVALTFISTGP